MVVPRQPWIADKLRAAGLDVVEHSGWQTRGSSLFFPAGVVGHHTASRSGSDVPSLRICINGRTDLAGPLCHVLISRSAQCHIIAAGRANHAGTGGYNGLSGNRSVLGIEVENNGVGEPWLPEVVQAFDRAAAALLDGINRSAEYYCGHKEWTSRKIDPAGLDMHAQRARIRTIQEGGSIMPERDLWKALQQALANLGVDPGPVDGLPGPKTQAGLLAAYTLAGGQVPDVEELQATIERQREELARLQLFEADVTRQAQALATAAAALADRTLRP